MNPLVVPRQAMARAQTVPCTTPRATHRPAVWRPWCSATAKRGCHRARRDFLVWITSSTRGLRDRCWPCPSGPRVFNAGATASDLRPPRRWSSWSRVV